MLVHFFASVLLMLQLSSPLLTNSPQELQVQILGFNDFHGQLEGGKNKQGGAAAITSYIQDRKQEATHTIFVHAGDMVGGSPALSALQHDEPTIQFMNRLQFNIGTLGNHEFDRGVTEMKRLLKGDDQGFSGASFPYICANVIDTASGKLLLPPYHIELVEGIPIAFIGVVTTDTPTITLAENVASVTFLDEATAINYYTAELKAQGVQAIIVLAHTPGTTIASITTGELAELAEKTDDEVDVIFGAHNHSYVNGIVNEKLLVQAYSSGSHFSDVELLINRQTKDITAKSASIVPVKQEEIIGDYETVQWLETIKEQTSVTTEQPVGVLPMMLTRKKNADGESTLGSFLADAQRNATGADIAFVHPDNIRGDLPAGSVTWGMLFSIQPFRHPLVTMKMSGHSIKRVLSEQWVPDTRMLQVSGLTYTWSNSEAPQHRIGTIQLADGTPLEDHNVYTVVVSSFLAEGGDSFSAFLNGFSHKEHLTDLEALILAVQTIEPHFTKRIVKQ